MKQKDERYVSVNFSEYDLKIVLLVFKSCVVITEKKRCIPHH